MGMPGVNLTTEKRFHCHNESKPIVRVYKPLRTYK